MVRVVVLELFSHKRIYVSSGTSFATVCADTSLLRTIISALISIRERTVDVLSIVEQRLITNMNSVDLLNPVLFGLDHTKLTFSCNL